jgi:hypothetical protein
LGWFDSTVATMRDKHFEFTALFRGLGKEYHHMIQKLGSLSGTVLEARIPSTENTRARGLQAVKLLAMVGINLVLMF